MELSSPQFWLFLGIAALVIWIKMRKGTPKPMDRGREITLHGTRLTTKITKSTPAACLLTNGVVFGPDHQEKTPPNLPHGEACSCVAEDLSLRMDKFFEGKKKTEETFETDLGSLDATDTRYYKYRLLTTAPDISQDNKKSYQELMEGVEVSETFKKLVEDNLKP